MSADPTGEARRLEVLRHGEVQVHGRLVDASNATLLARVTLDGESTWSVYKPVAGERPLWDFPDGTLARREVAAYELSAGTGLDVVPATVLRDGPFGPGSLQWWVDDTDSEEEDGAPHLAEPGAGVVDVVPLGAVPSGWRPVVEAEGVDGAPVCLAHADDPELRAMALFDVLANNADRKGGHVLRDDRGRLQGVDHGLTFHVEPKLRTVLWGWAGEDLPEELREIVQRAVPALDEDGELARRLRPLLRSTEVARTAARARGLERSGRFPLPSRSRPAIPWPAF